MGLGRSAIALLLEEAALRPFSGKIATLGRQTIGANAEQIKAEFKRFGVVPKHEPTTVTDDQLFRMMGFSGVESIDNDDYENATHILDLNQNSMPPQILGQFDVVLDGGTLEHVFHVPNALRNALSLLKPGGRIIFLSPSTNHVDHGFYMFSPTLFMDYLLTNGFSIQTFYFIRYSLNSRKRWRAYAYERDSFRHFSIGSLDSRPYMNFVVATKIPGATIDKIPQQTFYLDQWANKTALRTTGRFARLETILSRIPGALDLAIAVWPLVARRGRWGLRYVGDF
jgi:SAM-dependent methyltransferase